MNENTIKELFIYLALGNDKFATSAYTIEYSKIDSNPNTLDNYIVNKLYLIYYKKYQSLEKQFIEHILCTIIDTYSISCNLKKIKIYINSSNEESINRLSQTFRLLNNNPLKIPVIVYNQTIFTDGEKLKEDMILFKEYLDNNIISFSENNIGDKLYHDFSFFDNLECLNYNDLNLLSIVEGAIHAKNSLDGEIFGCNYELLIYLAIGIDNFAISTYITQFRENNSDIHSISTNFSTGQFKTLDLLHYKSYKPVKKESIVAEIRNIINSSNLHRFSFKKLNIYINSNNFLFNYNLYKYLKTNIPSNISIDYNNEENFIEEYKLKQDIILFKQYLDDVIINPTNDFARKRLLKNFDFDKATKLDYTDLALLSIVEGAIHAKGDHY